MVHKGFVNFCLTEALQKNFFISETGVYSSSNWPLFTRGKNSILNWVLKCNNKNCLDYLERALFILFLHLGVMNGIKSPTKRNEITKKEKDLVTK